MVDFKKEFEKLCIGIDSLKGYEATIKFLLQLGIEKETLIAIGYDETDINELYPIAMKESIENFMNKG